MKKYGILMVCLIFSLAAMSQKAVITFEKKNFDFGKVHEQDGKITTVFSFKNEGNAPLVVNRVQASCGCTTPTWSKEPIEPGKSGSVTVTYNPEGRPGAFTKTITVYSNAAEEQAVLIIKGEVIPKVTAENNPYPVNMRGIMVKNKVVQMNNIDKGKTQVRTLEIKNATSIIVTPTIQNLPAYLTASVTPETLKPTEEGKVTFTLNTAKCSEWGPVTNNVYLNINDQKIKTEDVKVIVVSNIVENFGNLTLDQKRKAPILEIPEKMVNLGSVKANSKKTVKFKVSNKGQNVLEIRRIINSNKELISRQSRLSIANGKTAEISLELNSTGLSAGDYKKSVTIQTNDPDNSFLILVINWTVEK
jgi:hypothetical protein